MNSLEDSRNIGPKTAQWLRDIGIESEEDIHRLGSVEVYRRLKLRYPDNVSLNALWALEATILGIRWDQLTPDMKTALKRELEES